MEYYHEHHFTLYQDNAFAKLKELEEKSVPSYLCRTAVYPQCRRRRLHTGRSACYEERRLADTVAG